MEYLPIFINLKLRPVLVIGGGYVAARKISLLMSVGAQIRVVSSKLCPPLKAIYHSGNLSWLGESFKPSMLDDVFLVIAATNDIILNSKISQYAEERRLLVNVVDDQKYCSFIFPSIIKRTPIILAISSGGTAPVLIRILREKLESMLPNFLGPMAKIAGKWRDRVKKHIYNMSDRRRFWEKVINSCFASQVAQNRIEQAEKTLEQFLHNNQTVGYEKGEVALVGAGPGDSGLLTLRGLQVIQQADVVLYDHLVSKEVLELVRRDAKHIYVGKCANKHSISQKKINRLLIILAKNGKKVVRLKGGDPFIFGRGGEELQAVAAKGIPFQVVPGITTAIGATAYAGIPLTHRKYAQSITFITGHISNNYNLNWHSLAHGCQTLVIYMGAAKAEEISNQLILHGRSAKTPVAVISHGTYSDQRIKIGILEMLDQLVKEMPTPILLVIGEVVNLYHEINWFGQQNFTKQKYASIVNLT